jgi:uncharacterized membrane protein YfcA
MTANQPYPMPPVAPAPYYQPIRKRPLGVTLLAILQILGGLFELILGIGFLLIAALVNLADIREKVGTSVPDWVINNSTLIFGVLGLFFIIMAIISLVLAWAFLKGKNWSRVLAIVFFVISIIGGVIGLFGGVSVSTVFGSIILPVIILLYLNMPNVKDWFAA